MSSGQIIRIAFLGPSRFGVSEPNCCGLESHTVTLARGLHELGHHVVVFAGPRDAAHQLPVQVVPIIDRPLLATATERLDTSTPAWFARHETHGYRHALDRVAAEFDVVHNNSLHPSVVAVSNNLASAGQDPDAHSSQWGRRRRLASRVRDDTASLDWSLCVAGRIVTEKSPHLAIDTANSLGWQLTLAGPVQDANSNVGVLTPTWEEPFGLVAAATLSLSVMLQRYIGLYEQGRSTVPLPRELNNEGFRRQRVGPASRL